MIDLNALSRYSENNRIEAKRATGGLPQSIWETYSAFANTIGGILLLGVEELADKSLQVVGLFDPEEQVQQFWEIIMDSRKVSVNILKREDVRIETVEDKKLIVIEVPRADRHDKPVYLYTDPFSGSYRRDGEGDYHCTEEEVRHMLRERGDLPEDRKLLYTHSLQDFCQETLLAYRKRLKDREPEHIGLKGSHEAFLRKLGAVGGNPPCPTAAGLLMFGRFPEIRKAFPYYSLVFRENGREVLQADSGDWSGNLYDFYTQVSEALAPAHQGTVFDALREGLANAVIHADYGNTNGILVEKDEDGITITNPGGMRNGLEGRTGVSDPRNTTLVKLFALAGIGSGDGTGLANMRSVSSMDWEQPEIREEFGPDRTIFFLRKAAEDHRKEILRYLTEQVEASEEELIKAAGREPEEVRKVLSRLLKADLITKQETSRGMRYRLKG